ncbi:MAG: nucleoside hydrolase [Verrucomicrobia bacterium]|nr:MAG: nucleoside hydrolase [Verrucomicrobiota bacterium]
MKDFEPLDGALLHERLAWPEGPVDVCLDTDTYNEIDDQFALVYTLLSRERINLKAVYAAPFFNERSNGPEDGMLKSYDEILRILDFTGADARLAFKGSDRWLPDSETPVLSPAVEHLIEMARASDKAPLYVVAIGAITNVASALLAAPDIRERIVVLWLAGQPRYWKSASEFNLGGDLTASRVIFDCGVPLVFFPCNHVAGSIRTTVAEMEAYARGRGKIGTYLCKIFRDFEHTDLTRMGVSKAIWDLAPLGWLVNREWCQTQLVNSPILTRDVTWSFDGDRHLIREAVNISRDGIFSDFFSKLERQGN